jgi:3-carboxy-cis,cis-muconate cycloisomerase
MPGLIATLHAAAIAEHERALGGWQAELAVVPDIAGQLGSSLDFLDTIASSLVVDAARMKANLAAHGTGTTQSPAPALEELLASLSPYL